MHVLQGMGSLSAQEKVVFAFHFFEITPRKSPNPEPGIPCSLILPNDTTDKVDIKFTESTDAAVPSELDDLKSAMHSEMQRTFIWRLLHNTFDLALHRDKMNEACKKRFDAKHQEMKNFIGSQFFKDTLALFYVCMDAPATYTDDAPYVFPSYDFKRMVQCKAIKEEKRRYI